MIEYLEIFVLIYHVQFLDVCGKIWDDFSKMLLAVFQALVFGLEARGGGMLDWRVFLARQ